MKIDNYIRHLELQRNGLKMKLISISKEEEKAYLTKKLVPHFFEFQEIRTKIEKIDSKLNFLRNLRNAMISNELQNRKSKRGNI